jgi:NADPH:quinone reductase
VAARMQAWLAREYGPWRDVLERGEAARPSPGPGEVLIRVRAAGVIYADLLTIAGRYQIKPPTPFAPGFEAVGIVEATGEGCAWRVGDRVVVVDVAGAWAEYAIGRAEATFAVPEAMSDAEAAGFVVNYHTAWFGLFHRGQLKPGETLLVHGGAGGVGTAAIQLGRAAGARVIATAGSREKVEVCRGCGAEAVIHHREEDFVARVMEITGGEGADVIYDPVGGDVFDRSTKCIAMDGRLVVIGFAEGRIPEIKANRLLLKNFSVGGFFFRSYRERKPELVARAHEELSRGYEGGAIRPVIFREYGFGQLSEALGAIESRASYGKAVLLADDAGVSEAD